MEQLSCDIAVQMNVVNPFQQRPSGAQSLGGMHGYH